MTGARFHLAGSRFLLHVELSIRYRQRRGNTRIVAEMLGTFRNCSECFGSNRDASEMLELTLNCSGYFLERPRCFGVLKNSRNS